MKIWLWVIFSLILFGIFQIGFYEEPVPKSLYLVLDNGFMAYNEYGDSNKSIILIHGSPGDKESLDLLATSIKDSKVYVLDLFCFGESTKEIDDCGIIEASKTIKDFMDYKNITTSSLLGYSWGGGVAITFAEAYPEKINKLILLDGNGIIEGEPTGNYFLEKIRSYLAYPFVVYYPGSFEGDYRWKRGFIKSFTDSDLRLIEKKLLKIKTPSLILHGDKDTIIRPWVAKKQDSLLENSVLKFFNGNHLTPLSNVSQISMEVNQFLNYGI